MKQGSVGTGSEWNMGPVHQESGSKLGIRLGPQTTNGAEQVLPHGIRCPHHDQVQHTPRKTREHLHVCQGLTVPCHDGNDPAWKR